MDATSLCRYVIDLLSRVWCRNGRATAERAWHCGCFVSCPKDDTDEIAARHNSTLLRRNRDRRPQSLDGERDVVRQTEHAAAPITHRDHSAESDGLASSRD